MPPPGLGPVSGVHALAPLVHLGVAAAFGGALWLTGRRLSVLTAKVAAASALLAWRWRSRPAARVVWPRTCRSWTPLERWGLLLWARPPPLAGGVSAL
jgi:hypothetical protein